MLDQLAAPTPPPTCPIPEPPVNVTSPGVAPVIPPRSSSRLASARQNLPVTMSRSNSQATDDMGRRASQDTMTTASVTSSPSEYSERGSTTSTTATSVVSSPGEQTAPLKMRTTTAGLSLRKIEEMGSGEPLREGFDARMHRIDNKAEAQRLEFQRRIDLALSEVEKLALEESDGEASDVEGEILAQAIRA